MSKLRVAVAGAGFISSGRHLPAWHKIRGIAEVVAVSDLNPALARTVAKTFGVRRTYADAGEMIAAERPDVLDICTPPATHATIASIAIRNDCHLLIEKPMALTVEDCEEIVAAALKKGREVCVAHTGLFYEPFLRAQQLVETGVIGSFQGMRIIVSTPTDYMTSKPEHWAHRLPGGAVGETGPHPIYMSLAFLHRVTRVSVEGVKLLPEYPWSQYEDYRINLIAEGGMSSISINYASNQWMVWVEIGGSEGSLFLDLHGRCVVTMKRPKLTGIAIGMSVAGQAVQMLKEAFATGTRLILRQSVSNHERLIHAFARSLVTKAPMPVTAEEGREAVRVMDMIARELDRQKLVNRADFGPNGAKMVAADAS
jgi:predicted dehydrogenase